MGAKLQVANSPKIDSAPVDGLLGVEHSLAYEVNEIERHVHNWERWMTEAAVAVGETHVADSINDNQASFQADGGNNDWGAWIQILGSSDTPVIAGMPKFDLHRMLVVGHEHNNNLYLMQIAFGASGAAALAAGICTEVTLFTGGGNTEVGPIEFLNKRLDAGTKTWARVWAVGQNTGTLNFLFGLHEYVG